MSEVSEYDILEYEDGMSIELPIEPYGFGLFTTQAMGAKGRQMLTKLRVNWAKVWPQLKEDLDFMLADHQTGMTLAKDDFEATLMTCLMGLNLES